MSTLSIWAIPALHDNYIWVAQRGAKVAIVDPGDAGAVLPVLQARQLELCAILITHHHWDHVGGVNDILDAHPVPVYGPAVDLQRITAITSGLREGDRIDVDGLDLELDVIEVPGHTLDHIAYFGQADGQPFIFCGDTLFSAGCGRLFEGDPATMHASLQRLAALPANTAVYCTHEYTEANLRFAKAVEPDNPRIDEHRATVQSLREQDQPSLPTTIGQELEINPFMRCDEPGVRQAAAAYSQQDCDDGISTFTAIRQWKDNF